MKGVGPPLITPFDETGSVDYDKLRSIVNWVEERGVDFIVPCGSNGEAELLTGQERGRVLETVIDEASVPVVAGTGHPGLQETLAATEEAAEMGAHAALVITPFYYSHDQSAIEAYYQELADRASIPIYLYSAPKYTGVRLEPETVGRLASHPNIHGMKDSLASIAEFIRSMRRVENEEFDLMMGTASVLSQALDVGASGAVMALANLAPAKVAEVYDIHAEKPERARSLNGELVDINKAVTATYGVPGLKWAMRERGVPAGHPRTPHEEIDREAQEHLSSLITELDLV